MANKVILIGNVGADPEVRAFESGNNVARLRLATTERYKKDGEVRSVSEWHNVECWGRTANLIDDYVRKGDRLYIEGSIHYTEYTDRQGVPRNQTIIRAQNIQQRLKERIAEALEVFEVDKLEAGTFRYSFRKSKSVEIIDLNALPDEFVITEKKADKKAIGDALKAGSVIFGAQLNENKSLQIR